MQLSKVRTKETERAIVSIGEFVLSKEYEEYYVPLNVWLSKSTAERERIFHRFLHNRRPTVQGYSVSTDMKLTIPVVAKAGKKPHQRRRRRAERTQN